MRPWVAVAVVACAALAGCSPGGEPAAVATTAPGTTAPAATVPPTVPATAGVTPSPARPRTDLADGRHVGYVKAISTSTRTLTVDVAQWLEGTEAERAWRADGHTEELPYSFYVRNKNPRLRTLPFAPGVSVTVNTLAAEETGSSSKDVTVSVAKFASYFGTSHVTSAPFHLTLEDGVVVSVREQYLP